MISVPAMVMGGTDISRRGFMELSQYNIITKKDNDYLLINTRTGYIVKLSGDKEKAKFEKMENDCFDFDDSDDFVSQLLEIGFIVENLSIEFRTVKENFDFYFLSDKFLRLTLIVTEDCNFGCKYCYENHGNISFDKDLYNSIYNTIKTGIIDGKYKNIEINFFGGEPMLQYNHIIMFLEKLNELMPNYPDVSLSCSIITNGYLLTLPRYEGLTNLGIKNYQVTIDGSEEDHNKYRPLLNGKGTWGKITDNLKDISRSDIKSRIYLRSNINYDISKKYVSFLSDIQKSLDNNIILQISPIKKFNENVGIYAEDKNIDEIIATMYAKSREMGIENMMKHELDFGCMVCKMALPNSYVIDPHGNLSKCTVYFKDDITQVGKILEDGTFSFNDNLTIWNNNKIEVKCKNCKVLPLCANRDCPYLKINNLNSENCNPSEKISSIIESVERGLI